MNEADLPDRAKLGSTERMQLRDLIVDTFDDEELRNLCFELRVDYDNLRGEGKASKARELVAHMDRRGEMARLLDAIKDSRPNLSIPHTKTDALSKRTASVRINLDDWSHLLEGNGEFANRLLRGQVIEKSEGSPFSLLRDFIIGCLDSGLSVEAFSERPQTLVNVSSEEHFWILLLSTTVLGYESRGPLKWLIKETVDALRKDNVNPSSPINNLWQHICDLYCNYNSSLHNPEVLDDIVAAAIDRSFRDLGHKDYDYLYRIFTFLFQKLRSDTLAIRQVVKHLTVYDERLGNETNPSYLERVKYLIGEGSTLALEYLGDLPRFEPELVSITKSSNCNYAFEAMTHPLTIYDYSNIRRVLPKDLSHNASYPYTFRITSSSGADLFNILTSEVSAIINLCQRREQSDEYQWDIPTLIEWLALADCEEKPYPWGLEVPSPIHASLNFGQPAKLRPVGTYPFGKSTYGTHDCCGNVHEITRINRGSLFPKSFRLAGGCYQTYFEFASCHIFRRFRTKQNDNRQNVGLRLIRYLKSDHEKRYQALQAFEDQLPNGSQIASAFKR